MEIVDAGLDNVVEVAPDNYLKVCLCKETCKNRTSLVELLKSGFIMMLYYENEVGDISPLWKLFKGE